jgi:hypothetical protein
MLAWASASGRVTHAREVEDKGLSKGDPCASRLRLK